MSNQVEQSQGETGLRHAAKEPASNWTGRSRRRGRKRAGKGARRGKGKGWGKREKAVQAGVRIREGDKVRARQ